MLQGFRNQDQHPLGAPAQQLLVNDHPGFYGLAEPHFVCQQNTRGMAMPHLFGDVQLMGDQTDPATGQPIAGARTEDGQQLRGSVVAALAGDKPLALLAGANTTIGVVATDAPLTKAQCQRLAGAGHDGLARAIRPVHTMSDGDTLFALSTGMAGALDFNVLCTMAGEAVARACVNAVQSAQGMTTDTLALPAASDLIAASARPAGARARKSP